eukprot:6178333-Pleurochrysis_carterae.AAC.2
MMIAAASERDRAADHHHRVQQNVAAKARRAHFAKVVDGVEHADEGQPRGAASPTPRQRRNSYARGLIEATPRTVGAINSSQQHKEDTADCATQTEPREMPECVEARAETERQKERNNRRHACKPRAEKSRGGVLHDLCAPRCVRKL